MKTLAQAAGSPQDKTSIPWADTEAAGGLTELGSERVYLRFAQQPTAVQLNQISAMGVTAYPDSWMPPVGNHKTGFILANMPIDKLEAVWTGGYTGTGVTVAVLLAAKDYIVMMDTAEEFAVPQNDAGRAAMNVGETRVWTIRTRIFQL